MNLRTIATITVVGGTLLATVCSDDSSSSNATVAPTAATTALVTTAVPPTTAAPPTSPATTAAAPTTVAEPPNTTAALPPALPDFGPLSAGEIYRIARVAIGRSIQMASPADDSVGFSGRGGFALNNPDGDLLLALVDTPRSQVFTNPVDDLDTLIDDDTVADAVSATPEDYLTAFAALPGVEAGTPAPAEILGFEGQSMPFTIGTLDGGFECAGVADKKCLLLFWLPTLNAVNLREGDSGTISSFDVDGRTIIGIVTDHPEAQAALDSMVVGA